ncbi:site-specific integrase [Enterococcus faecalis]|uniref:tyrosine-type recombinase/integrase n=1 Tax=Enterococcus faecalis TaxID=1351 RepID=UPI001E2A4710|nr:site-specific integrase [Enterococcus faecalis]EHR4852418.1 site-specific integrase [Enterococcus faecalis]EMC0698289.1 site-specific integrase [Enterococcus faecalis]MCD5130302.1 site-specific integrase [Enterococcus faecalis]MDV2557216.1 site-specific integrase [Enterococcus faecalis]MDY2531925.1 site-specific integrase [Enterococcus faecalis]
MSVRKDKKTNKWLVDISTKNLITRKRRRIVRKNFSTKQEAIEVENTLRATLLNQRISKQYGFIVLFELLLFEDRRRERKESYLATQQYMFDAHIREYFKQADISTLDYQVIVTYRDTLLKKGISNNYINKIMVLLKKLLDIAVRQKFLIENPCRLLKKLTVKHVRMNYWTIQEFLVFDGLFRTDEQIFQLFFQLAFFTGMRKGEILALTWQDVDLINSQIFVNKSIVKIKGKEVVTTPKTVAGNRTIAVHQKLNILLMEWKNNQKFLLKDYMERRTISEVRIFEETPFKIIDSDRLRKKYDSILSRDPGLKRIRIHDFRHSHVALLIHQDEKPYIIKERLGHASIQTTYDIYGHLYPSKQRKLADNLDSLY